MDLPQSPTPSIVAILTMNIVIEARLSPSHRANHRPIPGVVIGRTHRLKDILRDFHGSVPLRKIIRLEERILIDV